jgi:hypothetical protein
MRYTIEVIIIQLLVLIDIIFSSVTYDIVQVIAQSIIQVLMSMIFADIYNKTVLISLPPNTLSVPSGLRIFFGISVVRLAALILIRILHSEYIVRDINVIFDIVNVVFHITFLLMCFELGKTKYYNIRYTHVILG